MGDKIYIIKMNITDFGQVLIFFLKCWFMGHTDFDSADFLAVLILGHADSDQNANFLTECSF